MRQPGRGPSRSVRAPCSQKTALLVLAALAVAVIALVASDKSVGGVTFDEPAPQTNRSFIFAVRQITVRKLFRWGNRWPLRKNSLVNQALTGRTTLGLSLAVHMLFIPGRTDAKKFRPDFGPVVIKS